MTRINSPALLSEQHWLGTALSFASFIQRYEQTQEAIASGALTYAEDDEEDELHIELGEVSGNVAIIDISGDLVTEDSWYNKYVGAVSYAAIGRSLVAAANSVAVSDIVLNIGSSGGSVYGILDVVGIVDLINKSGKSVYAYTGSSMCSAAYFLSLPAKEIHVGAMATAGSIGTVAIHTDVTKMLDEIGIKKTVIRSGKFKFIGNPYEELDKTARAEIQANVDYLTGIFEANVVKYRGKSADYVSEYMAQGRTFIGQQAVDVGIADKVNTLNDLVLMLQERHDTFIQSENNIMGVKKPTPLLKSTTVAELAAAGIEVEQTDEPVVVEEPTVTEENAGGEAAAGAKFETTLEQVGDSGVVALLKEQLAEAQAKVTSLSLELAEANSKVATVDSMRTIILHAAQVMSVRLYGNASAVSPTLSNEALVEKYLTDKAALEAMFKVGQQSADSAEVHNPDEPAMAVPAPSKRAMAQAAI